MSVFSYPLAITNPTVPILSPTASDTRATIGNLPVIQTSNIDMVTLINELVAYAIILAGFLSIVFMLWGGIQYIVSGGKEDKVKSATATIRNAIIGLLITILSVSAINFVSQIFNLNLVSYVNWPHILDIINNLLSFRLS